MLSMSPSLSARLVLCLLGLAAFAGIARAATYPALFTYGDSWVDSNGVLGTWKAARQPPSPPNARVWSNGPTWPHYLAQKMGLSCPFGNFDTDAGVVCNVFRNYGMGGACTKWWETDPEISEYCTFNNGTQSKSFYPIQVQTHVNASVDATLNRDGLHIISVGGNDVKGMMSFDGSWQEDLTSMTTKPGFARDAIKAGVQDLYNAGARHFYLVNVVPILLLPRSLSVNRILREVADEFIQQYAEDFHDNVVTPLRSRLTNATITEINLLGCMYRMNAKCTFRELGFTNWTTACIEDRSNASSPVCPDPSKFVWWDDIHPSTAFHEVLAGLFKDVIDGKSDACLLAGCLGDSVTNDCPGGTDECSAAAPGGVSMWAMVGAVLLAVVSLGLSL
eukprot:jgi/Mesvir1/20450/Mv12346-RA.1